MTIEFFVLGDPIAQPRPRIGLRGGKPRCYRDSKHPVHAWKDAVRIVAMESCHGGPLEGPVSVRLAFFLPRPKSMCWKRRPMPREVHTGRPDADNVGKAVLDALLGVAFVDDSQVWQLSVTKWICGGDDTPGVHAIVEGN